MKTLIATLPKFLSLSLGVFALQTIQSNAQNVTNFSGFGLAGPNSQSGEGQALYGFQGGLTNFTLLSTLGPDAEITAFNHLATDVGRNRLVFTGNVFMSDFLNLFSYNLGTGTLTNITPSGPFGGILGSSVGASSGGGSFYNGSYYLWDDTVDFDSEMGLVKIDFNLAGNVSSITKPFGNYTGSAIGSLGDIAIDSTGIMYLYNSAGQLFSKDLNNAQSPIVSLNVQTVTGNGQLFIDANGRLLTSLPGGNWGVIDPATGNQTPIAGPSIGSNLFSDLSEGGFVGVVVPEPSSTLLVGLGALACLTRRSRR